VVGWLLLLLSLEAMGGGCIAIIAVVVLVAILDVEVGVDVHHCH